MLKRLSELLEDAEINDLSDMFGPMVRALSEVAVEQRIRDDRLLQRFSKKAVNATAAAALESVTRRYEQEGASILEESRQYARGFEERLYDKWGKALDLAEVVWLTAIEAGEAYHRRTAAPTQSWVDQALMRLHARACLISSEILALIRTGHASGALARWRALHEIAVVADFLSGRGEELSRRYMAHDRVAAYRGLADYQAFAERLNYEPFTPEEVTAKEAEHERLLREFGRDFRHEYGWAATEFGHAPTFRDIEQASNLSHLRPYCRMASHPTHAGPRAIHWEIGIGAGQRMMLAGPSDAGLADPGHGMCVSLNQVTATVLARSPEFEDLVALLWLRNLVDAAGEEFITAHRAVDAETRARIARVDSPDGGAA